MLVNRSAQALEGADVHQATGSQYRGGDGACAGDTRELAVVEQAQNEIDVTLLERAGQRQDLSLRSAEHLTGSHERNARRLFLGDACAACR